MLNQNVRTALGRHLVHAITAGDIDRLHAEIGRRGARIQANRVLAVTKTMFNQAERCGMRPAGSNPCRGVKRFPENRRERVLSSAEVVRVGQAIREVKAERRHDPAILVALQVLVLTGARRGEIVGLRWNEVDFEGRVLRLGDSKTGPKTITLGPEAAKLLAGLNRHSDTWVFPGAGTRPITCNTVWRVWKKIRDRAGIQDVHLHDLRHTFASVGVNGGTSLLVIGALLGHARPETTRRYAHLSDDPVREANEQIESKLFADLNGDPPAQVLPLRGA